MVENRLLRGGGLSPSQGARRRFRAVVQSRRRRRRGWPLDRGRGGHANRHGRGWGCRHAHVAIVEPGWYPHRLLLLHAVGVLRHRRLKTGVGGLHLDASAAAGGVRRIRGRWWCWRRRRRRGTWCWRRCSMPLIHPSRIRLPLVPLLRSLHEPCCAGRSRHGQLRH